MRNFLLELTCMSLFAVLRTVDSLYTALLLALRGLIALLRASGFALRVLVIVAVGLLALAVLPELFLFGWLDGYRSTRQSGVLWESEAEPEQVSRELLRASSAPEPPAKVLLRPASGVAIADPQHLLRASSSKEEPGREAYL